MNTVSLAVAGLLGMAACSPRPHAEAGTAAPAVTGAPFPGDSIDPVSGYEQSCMFDTTHAHPDGRALLVEFLERDSRGDFLQTDKWFNSATDCPGSEPGPDSYDVIASYSATYIRANDTLWVAAITTRDIGWASFGGPPAYEPFLAIAPGVVVDTVRAINTRFGWRVVSPALRQHVLLSANRAADVRGRYADSLAKLGIR